MAGYWIKTEHLLPDKPEVYRIADALSIDPDAVVGKLLRVWIWADQQLVSGCAESVTFALLDRLTSCEGFGAAMQKAGWLVVSRKGITFPNFERHNGQTAKNRGLAALRVMRSRYGDVTLDAQPKKEKESKRKENPPSPLPIEGEAFAKAWADWIAYRAERGQPLTGIGEARLLKRLAGLGATRAVALIERSIENGYTGLIFEEASNNARQRGERMGGRHQASGQYDGVHVEPIGGASAEAASAEGLATGKAARDKRD